MTKNVFPRPRKIEFSLNRFFDVLGVAKRRRRLEFWQRVAFDFPNAPGRPKNVRNRFFFQEFPRKLSRSPPDRGAFGSGSFQFTYNTRLIPAFFTDAAAAWRRCHRITTRQRGDAEQGRTYVDVSFQVLVRLYFSSLYSPSAHSSRGGYFVWISIWNCGQCALLFGTCFKYAQYVEFDKAMVMPSSLEN